EERRRGRAIRERETLARGPRPARDVPLEPSIGGVELLARVGDALGVALLGCAQPVGHDLADRRLHIVVEEAVEEARFEGGGRILGEESHRSGMMNSKMLDDDRRLRDRTAIVDQQREFTDRPEAREFLEGGGIGLVEQAIVEARAVLVERDQRLLTISRE